MHVEWYRSLEFSEAAGGGDTSMIQAQNLSEHFASAKLLHYGSF